ncbi:hypothetical protein JXB41_02890 [Candidatus Woesearchaeota archaeon]|nr:hypothetical protein [Candidatus Woesearchaeota archaeon]
MKLKRISLLVLIMFVLSAVSALGAHDADITIEPDIANCGELGNTFTTHVQNKGSSIDDIFEVRIYKGTYGMLDFDCGPAPLPGWTLSDYAGGSGLPDYGYCEYKTSWDGSYVIEPGETLDFTFDAVMWSEACYSEFLISTLDNKRPVGDHKYYWPIVSIDCVPPVIDKSLKLVTGGPGYGIGVCPPDMQDPGDECWIQQETCIYFQAYDTQDQCDLGLDYCEWSYTVDGVLHDSGSTYPESGGMADDLICFNEDSVHVLTITCYDEAGNVKEDIETFRVDDTPPDTTKTISEPKKVIPGDDTDEYIEWVDSVTLLTLNAVDPDPTGEGCNIGVEKIYWKIIPMDEVSCWDPANFCNPVDTSYNVIEDDEVIINTEEESCHMLQYYAVDELGNMEDEQTNCFFVDKTPPELIKTVGDPNVPCRDLECDEFDYWVRDPSNLPGTAITMDCDDSWGEQAPHPSGNEEVCYKVSYDLSPYDITADYCPESLETVADSGYEGDWCCVDAPEDIIFVEDSLHDLEFFCRDAVNKKSDIDPENFRVDSLPPIITKTMIGTDHLGECPPGPSPAEPCYVADNGENGVHISVVDDDSMGCAVDDLYCYYEVWWETSSEECGDRPYEDGWCLVDEDEFSSEANVIFEEDSTHELYIYCEDALGNYVEDTETFLVDSTPPVTTKTYDESRSVVSDGYRWIDIDTLIELDAVDAKVGVDHIEYRVTYEGEFKCPEVCDEEGAGNWMTVAGDHTEFFITDESCHFIEFRAVDKLGNTEDMNSQCVMVDNTPPVTTKVVGQPQVLKDDKVYINQNTDVTLTCTDSEPHPVDNSMIWYRYRISDDCETWGEWVTDGCTGEVVNGWCDSEPATETQKTINFPGDSCHELEYYCVDALGNEETHQFEIDVVDSKAPEITKEIIGPQIGDCPPVEEGDICFIDGVTTIEVTATDPEPHPVGNVICEWMYRVYNGEEWSSWTEWSSELPINFPEESQHELVIMCYDELGNGADDAYWDYETFYVDKTPPTTTKTYGDPFFTNGVSKWITSQTPITLTVEDTGAHKSGIKETKYRITLLDGDEACEDNGVCQEATGNDVLGGWQTYTYPFTLGEESCHLIEYYSVDNVDKTEITKKQCVFVDNTAPTPTKEVGDPMTEWYPVDVADEPLNPDATHFYPWIVDKCWQGEDSIDCWKVTMDTPISMECNDPDPHPVDHERVCFRIELDGKDVTNGDGCAFTKCGFKLGYCSYYGGVIDEETGYCCVPHEIENFKFMEESEHNLEYYCIDALGNSNKEDVDEEKFKVIGEMFKIRLNDKWNLISVPFVLLNDEPEAVFKDTESVKTVWSYDGNGVWHVYRPENPEISNLEEIVPGEGYWVLADCAESEETMENIRWECGPDKGCDMLVVGGSLYNPGPVVPPSKNLEEGWNLIGYYGTEGRWWYNGPDAMYWNKGKDAYCELYSLRNLGGSILNPTKWSGLVTYWEPYNDDFNPFTSTWKELGYCDEMDPGAGYWVSMDAGGSFKPETTCEGIWGSLCSVVMQRSLKP